MSIIYFNNEIEFLTQIDPPSTMSKTYFRLIIVSSRARNKLAIYASVLPNVIVMEYTYETNTLQDIADLVKGVLRKVSIMQFSIVCKNGAEFLFY